MKYRALIFTLFIILPGRLYYGQEFSLDDKATAATNAFDTLIELYNGIDRLGIASDVRITEGDQRLVSISIETSPAFAASLEVVEETCEYYLGADPEALDVTILEQSLINATVTYWETQYVFIMGNFQALSLGAKSYIQEKSSGNSPVREVKALENFSSYPPAEEYYQRLCTANYLEQNRQLLKDPERMAEIHKPARL